MKTGLRLHIRNTFFHSSFFVFLSLYLRISSCFFSPTFSWFLILLQPLSHICFPHPSLLSTGFSAKCVWETGTQRKMDGNTICLCICCLLFNLLNRHFVFTLRGEWERKKQDDEVKCGLPQEATCWIELVKFLSLLHYHQQAWHKLNTC